MMTTIVGRTAKTASLLLLALAPLATTACSGDAASFRPASGALQALGIDSYLLTDDAAVTGRYDVSFRQGAAFVGELDGEADGSVHLTLHGVRFEAALSADRMRFALDAEAGTLALDGAGNPDGDAPSVALWERARAQRDAIATIASELSLARPSLPEVTVAAASARCHANPMYVDGVYLNVFCPFNRVASCQSWLQNNCPFGRVCSNDSHSGDCFRGLEACGGYCDCSSYGTGCSVNSDCCSNNCASNGHAKTCH